MFVMPPPPSPSLTLAYTQSLGPVILSTRFPANIITHTTTIITTISTVSSKYICHWNCCENLGDDLLLVYLAQSQEWQINTTCCLAEGSSKFIVLQKFTQLYFVMTSAWKVTSSINSHPLDWRQMQGPFCWTFSKTKLKSLWLIAFLSLKNVKILSQLAIHRLVYILNYLSKREVSTGICNNE